MIETRYFEQLCPKPLYRIRNQYRYCDRKKLPVSLMFLTLAGVDPEKVRPLQKLAAGDRVDEMVLAAYLLLHLFAHQPLKSRQALETWLRRKGRDFTRFEEPARAFAAAMLAEVGEVEPAAARTAGEGRHHFCCSMAGKSLLSSTNDKRLRIEEPLG